MTRDLISVRTETYALINKARGNKTFNAFLWNVVTKYRKVNQELDTLRKEITTLREQLNKEESQPLQKLEVDCPALLQLPEGLFCCKNAPKIVELASPQICITHQKFYRIKEKLTQDYFYTTCGAEQIRGQDGEQWMKCPLDLNQLHRWTDCQKVHCKFVKPLKVEGGR